MDFIRINELFEADGTKQIIKLLLYNRIMANMDHENERMLISGYERCQTCSLTEPVCWSWPWKFIAKKMKCVIIILGLVLLAVTGCEKENVSGVQSKDPLTFHSLKAEKDSVTTGTIVKIKATAYGYNLSYDWYVSAGEFNGSGAEISYVAAPCKCGGTKITCYVQDGYGYSDTKSIYIMVSP